ncbi:hypothetical protein NA56DRAFT_675650 [Hyaloscypha hepaticicola]|uniref:ER-bound oxygenase mpaB/mpaB'/Rubber oxygenase catalytic domain-containing protein n=1 Tax=Hyaloscypha hepaticicola TaxID=2082293 RepID=A0A2J6QQE2_9HELO|nr:hypothetical protein NA56DRAFT_675650 [Hyaloscypha hepaticicola]
MSQSYHIEFFYLWHLAQEMGCPVIPSSDLECLQPGYNPKNLQMILKESILLGTGGVAILLQMAHPGVAHGVDEFSNFAYRPSDRLRTTMTFMYCMAWGTIEEKRTIIEMVHRAHAPVNGPGYTANDPHLQLWVASTLFACGVHMHKLIFGEMKPDLEDKVYQEFSVMATSLRVPPELWPENRQAFWKYWDEKVKTLPISSHAKNVAIDLLYNKAGPWWLRVNLPLIRLITAEQLPPRMRDEYGLKAHHKRYKAVLGTTRAIYRHLPGPVRHYSVRYYLKDMRKRMDKMRLEGKI